MAVLITADVKGQTQAGYDAMLAAVGPALERARVVLRDDVAQRGVPC